MIREIIKIDEELCNGCGLCVPGCPEGALQIIDGKARLVSDLMCDGLGACIGECPEGAITIEKREADAYDEVKVIQIIAKQGKNTTIAHLKHLKEHGEFDYLKQAVGWLSTHTDDLDFDFAEVRNVVHNFQPGSSHGHIQEHQSKHEPVSVHSFHGGGCPGSQTMDFREPKLAFGTLAPDFAKVPKQSSELRQWPVQMHLISPNAPYFRNADVVLAADCVAFTLGDFHQTWLKGKSLAIACPKLDSQQEIYLQKLVAMIDQAQINTLTVMIMEVPCCGGLLQMAKAAVNQAQRKIPVKRVVVGIKGDILKEEWV